MRFELTPENARLLVRCLLWAFQRMRSVTREETEKITIRQVWEPEDSVPFEETDWPQIINSVLEGVDPVLHDAEGAWVRAAAFIADKFEKGLPVPGLDLYNLVFMAQRSPLVLSWFHVWKGEQFGRLGTVPALPTPTIAWALIEDLNPQEGEKDG